MCSKTVACPDPAVCRPPISPTCAALLSTSRTAWQAHGCLSLHFILKYTVGEFVGTCGRCDRLHFASGDMIYCPLKELGNEFCWSEMLFTLAMQTNAHG